MQASGATQEVPPAAIILGGRGIVGHSSNPVRSVMVPSFPGHTPVHTIPGGGLPARLCKGVIVNAASDRRIGC